MQGVRSKRIVDGVDGEGLTCGGGMEMVVSQYCMLSEADEES
jgi:hypothetical protein